MTRAQWKPLRGSSAQPDQVLLTIRGDPAREMTVRWRTDVCVKTGFALFRPAGSNEAWRRADADAHRFQTDLDDSRFFFARLTPLVPDTLYEYTVGNDTRRSNTFTFRSARERITRFSFLCLADIQTGGPEPPADHTAFGEILKRILTLHPECEFILTAGDNTNCGQTDVQWTGLFRGLDGIAESVPVMFCLGNHDDIGFADYFTFRGKYYSEHAEYFTNMLFGSYNRNGPAGREIESYAFDYGNVHFNVLGTSGYREMNDWLLSDAARSEKPWKFAVHHFPVCYAAPTLEIEDTYPALRDGMEQCDIVFSGHEHSFARSYPRRSDGLYDKPSQGTVHYNLGSGNRNPPDARVVPKIWNAKTYAHEEPLSMYSVVDVDGARCTLTAYSEDGRIVDQCVIDKDRDLILPYDCAPVYDKTRLAFKGYDLGMCTEETLPRKIGDVWYVAPGPLIAFAGGTVTRTKGRLRVEIYDRFAEFAENDDRMASSFGETRMEAPCLRLERGQLFVPLAALCEPLRMHYIVFEHNNFITVESETEARPIPAQP